MDRYPAFENLAQGEQRDRDYRIRWRAGSSGIAIFSIHGGLIEPGTTRIAEAIAGQEHAFYAFEGLKRSGNLSLHITSTHFDEPIALGLVRESEIIITIHGFADLEPMVQLGGLDDELKRMIAHELRAAGFPVALGAGLPFSGTDQKNICNLCGRGMGVQLEISRGLRASMFRDLSPQGRHYPTPRFVQFTQAVRRAIAPFAVLLSESQPLKNTD